MAREKVTPAQKPVPTSGGIKDGGHSTITTPMKSTRKYWGGKKETGKILK